MDADRIIDTSHGRLGVHVWISQHGQMAAKLAEPPAGLEAVSGAMAREADEAVELLRQGVERIQRN